MQDLGVNLNFRLWSGQFKSLVVETSGEFLPGFDESVKLQIVHIIVTKKIATCIWLYRLSFAQSSTHRFVLSPDVACIKSLYILAYEQS